MTQEIPKLNNNEKLTIDKVREKLQTLKNSIEAKKTQNEKDPDDREEIRKLDKNIETAKKELLKTYLEAIDKNKNSPHFGRLPPNKLTALFNLFQNSPQDVLIVSNFLTQTDKDERVRKLDADLDKLAKEMPSPEDGKTQGQKIFDAVNGFANQMEAEGGPDGNIFAQAKKLGITKEMLVDGVIDIIIKVLEKLSVIPLAAEVAGDLKFMQMKKQFERKAPVAADDAQREKDLETIGKPEARERYIAAYKEGKNPTYLSALGLPEAAPVAVAAPDAVAGAAQERVKLNIEQDKQILVTKLVDGLNLTIVTKAGIVTVSNGTKTKRIKDLMSDVTILKANAKQESAIVFTLKESGKQATVSSTNLSETISSDKKVVLSVDADGKTNNSSILKFEATA
ncbi:hypothetical protein EXS65_05035 [Candidatus Peribacteria bacterium]|nr:hypothetical protein [Candidatus Peribacteria bacterium]